ncbi:MAG: trimethylamine methyltransferase family protein, partial [Anaerolineae bacterium]|nr:trimethylamine methyltransferase family protein [Anaerolineae bacterium]
AFYMPRLCYRDALPAWQEKGSTDMAQRAHQYWQRLLQTHQPAEPEATIIRALEAYVERHS